MKSGKRLLVGFMAFLMLLSAVPASEVLAADVPAVSSTALQAAVAVEHALFPLKDLKISRTNKMLDPDQANADPEGGHVRYAFDVAGTDTTAIAPFSMKVISIGGSNSVIFQSLNKVKLANGKVEYLTCMFTHDDNISNIKVDDEFKQGEYFYDQGTYGPIEKKGKTVYKTGVFDKHLHIEVAVGKVCSKNKSFESNLTALRDNGIHVHEALFLESDTIHTKDHIVISKQNGKIKNLDWKTLSYVSFDANDGTVSQTKQTYVVGQKIGTLPTPTAEGFVFDGWYTQPCGGTKITSDTVVPKGNPTYYAQWNIAEDSNKFMLAYNGNGGSGVMLNRVISDFSMLTLDANKFVKQDYYFTGWKVQRKSDGKWLTDLQLWTDDPETSHIGTLKIYPDRDVFSILELTGIGMIKSDVYVLHAVWEKCTEHKWNNGYYKVYPTTKTTGQRVYTCLLCKKTKTEVVPKSKTPVPQWKNYNITGVTETNAVIKATVDFRENVKHEKCGFYFGTNKNQLTKSSASDTINKIRPYTDMWYDLNKAGYTLKPGTTYFYQFYVVVNGQEHKSEIRNFNTAGQIKPPSISDVVITDTVKAEWSKLDSLRVGSKYFVHGVVDFSELVKQETAGFYFGTSEGSLQKVSKSVTIDKARKMSYFIYEPSQYGQTLQPGTTYYYQLYVIANGKEYKSEVKSFKTKEAASLQPSWTGVEAANITKTNALIKATVDFKQNVKHEQCGFYFGASAENLTKAAKFDTILKTRTYTNMWYDLNKYGQTLKADTTYYYQFYMVADGKEYKSEVSSFKTAAAGTTGQTTALNPVWSNYDTSGITQTNATIKVKVTYGKSVVPERCGFYFGTAQNSLSKSSAYDAINKSRTYSEISYDLNKSGHTLKAGTTYYYQFYVIVDGVEYKSEVKSLKTAAASQTTTLNPVWSNYGTSGITQTNATIKVKVTYGKTVVPERCGFYFGTAQNSLSKSSAYDAINKSRTYSEISYDLNKSGHTLKAGTTYYYQFYVIVDGAEYKSEVKSLKTAAASQTTALNPVWSNYGTSGITQTNATIKVKVTYGKTVVPERCGFYFGTAQNSLSKSSAYDAINKSRTYSEISYDLNKSGHTLKAGTTYYYQFYVIVDGVEYKSDIKTLTTKK